MFRISLTIRKKCHVLFEWPLIGAMCALRHKSERYYTRYNVCVYESQKESVCVYESQKESVCVYESQKERVCVYESQKESVCVYESQKERVCVRDKESVCERQR